MINMQIDGEDIKVEEGTPVLKAAQILGIKIPTFCYHESLPPSGSCRVCIVEMEIEKRGKKRNWIDAACVYPAEEGLIIKTNSEKVKRERKIIIELLLSRAPNSRALLELAEEYGANRNRFKAFDEGEANCILCGLCVRVCNELIGANSIGTAFRGVHKKVLTPLDVAGENCIGCAACAYVCPTGAIKIIESEERLSLQNWHVELEMLRCKNCGKIIGPKVQIKRMLNSLNISLKNELFELCPECRRINFSKYIKLT